MTKKMIIAVAIALCAFATFARPHGGPGFRGPHGGFGRGPAPMMHHRPMPPPMHHHHGSVWGRGGSHFWPGFVGGVIGGALTSSIYPTTTVVTSPVVTAPVVTTTPVVATPVYTTQQVWIPGGYVDQVQPNGTVLRVWQPGHYVTRQVLVQ
jgi:drug/metabolite transporter (DMT)-like permease